MKLLTKEIRTQLIRNGEHSAQASDFGDPELNRPAYSGGSGL